MSDVLWIGADRPAAGAARARLAALPGVRLAHAPTLAAATALAARGAVVVDARERPDWARTFAVLRHAGPAEVMVAWAEHEDDRGLELALAAGFDAAAWGPAPGWEGVLRHAGARAAARARVDEEAHHAFFRQLPLPACVLDARGQIAALNPALARILGHRTDSLAGAAFASVLHPDDRAAHGAAIERVLRGQEDDLRAELRMVAGPGAARWVSCHLFGDGSRPRPRRVFALLEDVTERRASDAQRRDREERARALFEHTAIAIAVTRVTEAWLQINPAMQRMLGLEPRVLGERLMERTHPEDRLADAGLFHELLAGTRNSYQIEKRYLHPETGETIWGILSASLERDAAGAPHTLYATLVDITERRRAEERLRTAERSVRELYQVSSAPDLSFGEKLRGLLRLGCERFALESGLLARVEGERCTVVEARSPDPALTAGATFALAGLSCGEPVRASALVATAHVTEDPAWRDRAPLTPGVEAYVGAPVRVGTEMVGTLCFFGPEPRAAPFTEADRDFLQLMARWVGAEMERERAEAALLESQHQLAQAQKMEAVGRLTGGVAHDFNNLLTAIRGYAQLLLADHTGDAAAREDLEGILSTAERGERLTQQLLAFSRKQVLRPAVLDTNAVVAGMEHMLRRLLGSGVELVLDLDPRAGPILADLGQLEQVLLNLAVNARDAMAGGGELTVTTRGVRTGEREERLYPRLPAGTPAVLLSVADTGHGMDEETRARAFDPFFTTKDVGKGTGLGLSTVYGIVKQSGGYVWVASEPGRGTVVEIYLPAAEGAAK